MLLLVLPSLVWELCLCIKLGLVQLRYSRVSMKYECVFVGRERGWDVPPHRCEKTIVVSQELKPDEVRFLLGNDYKSIQGLEIREVTDES